MIRILKWLICDEKGQGMAEYGLLIALIAIATVSTLTFIGSHLSGLLEIVDVSLVSSVPSP